VGLFLEDRTEPCQRCGVWAAGDGRPMYLVSQFKLIVDGGFLTLRKLEASWDTKLTTLDHRCSDRNSIRPPIAITSRLEGGNLNGGLAGNIMAFDLALFDNDQEETEKMWTVQGIEGKKHLHES